MILNVESGVITTDLRDFRIKAKNDIYMEVMVKALAETPSDYILYDGKKHSEGTVMSEFYYQWRVLLKKNNPNDLHLNTEVTKFLNPINVNEWKSPDVILHHSQADNDDNRIACEIKRQGWNKEDFYKDLNTLNLLLTSASERLDLRENFKWGVFIQFGGSMERIEKYIENKSFNKDIWCIVVNDDVTQIAIETIGDMKLNSKTA